jgi:phosphopantetheine adenylyltransferase
VREIAAYGGNVSPLVPPLVDEQLRARLAAPGQG